MAHYRKKPQIIDAIELGKDTIPDNVKIKEFDNFYKVYNELHNSWIKAITGDMVRVDQAPHDVYPIDRKTFDQTYEKAD